MLATPGPMPADQANYAYEIKWDGIRAVIEIGGGKLFIRSRNGNNITARYPELSALTAAVGRHRVVLDGEIISLGEHGRPSFTRLQHRMHLTVADDIRRMAASQPVFLVLFDLLRFDRRSLLSLPYTKRRAELESLGLSSQHWQITPARFGEGGPMLQIARDRRLEGVVAKRLDSSYQPGRRSTDWVKVKLIQRQEFVIGGWVAERGDDDRIGALLIGVHDDGGRLKYAGKVGTGLSSADHAPLLAGLRPLRRPDSPFFDESSKANFVKPVLVGEVEFRRWPKDGWVHQASFKGLRTDKRAADVVRESAASD